MAENFENNASTGSADTGFDSRTNRTRDDKNCSEEAEKKAALKKRRGWLGVKSAFSTGSHGEDYQPVSYGDGHSGWNR